jgi:hypothetical protein
MLQSSGKHADALDAGPARGILPIPEHRELGVRRSQGWLPRSPWTPWHRSSFILLSRLKPLLQKTAARL